MITGTDKCQFELYIINNEKYTDFEVGKMFDTQRDNGYDLGDDINEIVEEIAKELYRVNEGQLKLMIEVRFIYEKNYAYDFGCYEYDLDYEFTAISKEESKYFDDVYK